MARTVSSPFASTFVQGAGFRCFETCFERKVASTSRIARSGRASLRPPSCAETRIQSLYLQRVGFNRGVSRQMWLSHTDCPHGTEPVCFHHRLQRRSRSRVSRAHGHQPQEGSAVFGIDGHTFHHQFTGGTREKGTTKPAGR